MEFNLKSFDEMSENEMMEIEGGDSALIVISAIVGACWGAYELTKSVVQDVAANNARKDALAAGLSR